MNKILYVLLQEFIHVHVRDVNTMWSSMFRIMEDIRDEFDGVEDYSISETSLEQVFISFAKKQKSTDHSRRRSVKKSNSIDDEESDEVQPANRMEKIQRYLSRVSENYDWDNYDMSASIPDEENYSSDIEIRTSF